MKIKSLVTKQNDKIDIGDFTVLVGPNNVGKSQTLIDIHSKMRNGFNTKTTIIKEIDFEKPSTFEELIDGLNVEEDPTNTTLHLISGILSDLKSGVKIQFNLTEHKRLFNEMPDLNFILGNISKFHISFLDAASRLVVAQTALSYNPHTEVPKNLLQALFGSNLDLKLEDSLRKAFKDAFDMDIVLDYSGMKELMFRVATIIKEMPEDPRKAYPVASKYEKLDKQGDGFRSFVGVVLSLLLSKGRIVLLDEPEAFLHPAQAKLLGAWIAENSKNFSSQIIIATHNANFLWGILTSSQNINIYRLNREGDRTSYNRMTSDATSKLVNSPLLSSQRVLEAIFYKGVVVCEADADRSVYYTVSVRKFKNQNILFIHAHNKQVIKDVVNLLKEVTIPISAITDIDIINNEPDFKSLLKALNGGSIPEKIFKWRNKIAESIEETNEELIIEKLKKEINEFTKQLEENKHTLLGARAALRRINKEITKWDPVKRLGIKGIPEQEKRTARELIKLARSRGLFIVPVGELESWLKLGTRQKKKWIVLALKALHRDESSTKLNNFVSNILKYMGEKITIQ